MLLTYITPKYFSSSICNDIEESFNLNFLLQYLFNVLYLCFILFDLDIVSISMNHDMLPLDYIVCTFKLIDRPNLLVNLTMFLLAIQSDLIMCSIYGQHIVDEASNCSNSIK